jgi:hypothetical protein
MRKLTGIAAVAVASLALSACATTPISLAEAQSVPAGHLYAFQSPTVPDSAVLLITRDQGFLGSGCYYALYINDKLAARFNNGEKASFYVKPGQVLLRYGRDPQGRALCSTGENRWSTHETVMKPKQTKQFRLTLDANGRPIVQRAY